MSQLKNRIREVRNKKKISGTKMAKDLGISAQYYYDLEKGERNLSADLARKIAELLEVSISYLLGDDNDPDINTYDYNDKELNAAILEKLKVLTDDEGHFFEDVQADVFNVITESIYMGHAFHDATLHTHYITQFNEFFNSPYEEYNDSHRIEMYEEFNHAYNYRTIKLVLDKNNYDNKIIFFEGLNKCIAIHGLKSKNPSSHEKEFIKKLELSDKSNLEEYDLTLDGEKLTEDEAKGIIAYLRSLRSIGK